MYGASGVSGSSASSSAIPKPRRRKMTIKVREGLRAAVEGDHKMQYQLALKYEKGWGCPKNEVMAANWYKKAADSGDKWAMCRLARCYEFGIGLEVDVKAAAKLHKKAAALGVVAAQIWLGGYYERGIEVLTDDAKALKWYKVAAEGGSLDGLYHMGRCNELEIGTPRNYQNAAAYYRRAANYGHQAAQLKLAKMQPEFRCADYPHPDKGASGAPAGVCESAFCARCSEQVCDEEPQNTLLCSACARVLCSECATRCAQCENILCLAVWDDCTLRPCRACDAHVCDECHAGSTLCCEERGNNHESGECEKCGKQCCVVSEHSCSSYP